MTQPAVWACLSCALVLASACAESTQPEYVQVVELSGTPYERGLQHGQLLGPKVRSMYTRLLQSSLLPYLNRLRPDLAAVLMIYQDSAYDDGKFPYKLLLDSGRELAQDMPPAYLEEIQGVADGASMEFDKVLVLNTFVDSMLALRSISFFLEKLNAPDLRSISFGDLAADGMDNDEDGVTDEAGEGTMAPYIPVSWASMSGVATDVRLRFVLADPDGVDAATVRLQLDDQVFTTADGSGTIVTTPLNADGSSLEVVFTPPEHLPPAAVVAVQLTAGDQSLVVEPPPAHARFSRNERIVFTTVGDGRRLWEVENRGRWDALSQPPAVSFAVRGTATGNGDPLVAHHFALLDINTAHKHSVLFIHRPDEGHAHVTLGWAGMVWGFSGMNSEGLTYATSTANTLDNPMVGRFVDDLIFAQLLSDGMLVGVVGRELLTHYDTVDAATDYIRAQRHSFGWNMLVADAGGDLAALELDSNIGGDPGGNGCSYTPDTSLAVNRDPWGRAWASVGPDDVRIGSHFPCNNEDIELSVDAFTVPAQRFWSFFYFRSLRAFFLLGDQIEANYGAIDTAIAIDILRDPDLVDTRDSMSAVVFEPAARTMRYAMGQVPATDGDFVEFDLGAVLRGEVSP